MDFGSGGGGSGVVVKSSCTNSRRWVMRLVGVMLQRTSVVLSKMQVIDGKSRPAERFVNIPLQCGSFWTILLICFG